MFSAQPDTHLIDGAFQYKRSVPLVRTVLIGPGVTFWISTQPSNKIKDEL